MMPAQAPGRRPPIRAVLPTRQGLLKALSRECRVPLDRLTADAAAALAA
jgi:hypothetical protein